MSERNLLSSEDVKRWYGSLAEESPETESTLRE